MGNSGSEATRIPGLPECSNPSLPWLKPTNQIETTGARDARFFETPDNTEWLAFANYGTDLDGTQTDSIEGYATIYKKNNGAYIMHQKIPFTKALKVKYFERNGTSYLLATTYYDGTYLTHKSILYKWNSLGKIVETNFLITDHANDIETIHIGERFFLLVTNIWNGGDYHIDSNLWEWKSENDIELYQSISTHGASDAEFYSIEGNLYLAIANWAGENEIFKWNGEKFVSFQKLGSDRTQTIKYVHWRNNHYLLVGITGTYPTDTRKEGRILKWNHEKEFVEVGNFPGMGIQGIGVSNGDCKLSMVVANRYDSDMNSAIVNSTIFEWKCK